MGKRENFQKDFAAEIEEASKRVCNKLRKKYKVEVRCDLNIGNQHKNV